MVAAFVRRGRCATIARMSAHHPPGPPRRAPATKKTPSSPAPAASAPLGDAEIDELQRLLDAVPAPFEPLDASMLDGFLCGVLLQPQPVAASRWLPFVTDADGRPLPPEIARAAHLPRLHALAQRRHAELDEAIRRRQWFDPWIFELGEDDAPEAGSGHGDARQVVQRRPADHEAADETDHDGMDDDEDAAPAVDAVYPWVAGFAAALETFPDLLALDAAALTEPLALIYRHLDPDDLEDADDLFAEIETLEPPRDLAEAVEELVRATLLLADVSRPLPAAPQARRPRPPRGASRR